jgi:uncharacterized membrane protein YhiD involved in acid resistance
MMWQWVTDRRLWLLFVCAVATALFLSVSRPAAVEPDVSQLAPTPTPFLDETQSSPAGDISALRWSGFWETLVEIAPVLLLAALLGGLIAYRRRVTVFEHNLFHAHILLSVAGALMMLIVGNQLARAFGLLGAASVVRYRYGLRNPRDASMLIIALGVGMATGVHFYGLAVSAAAVVFFFSRGLDFLTTRSNLLLVVTRPTRLRVRTIQPEETMLRIEQVFTESGVGFELRRYRRLGKKRVDSVVVYSLDYSVQLGAGDRRERLTAEISAPAVVSVRWGAQKPKKG